MAEARVWKDAVVQEQQMFYEMLGDRDWDCYKDIEMEFLERNVGLAMYGPPEELPDKDKNGGTGYSRKSLEHIRKVCATIQMFNKKPSGERDTDLWVATIFVCLDLESSVPIPLFRIPSFQTKSGHSFVDSNCRVYDNWDHYLQTNQLPKCSYCYPTNGVYDSNENDRVVVEFGKTPACELGKQLCSVLDTTSTMVVVGGLAVTVAGMLTPLAPALLAASASSAFTTGVYGALRSLAALVDRREHRQSVSVDDPEARACWLAMAGNSLGVASAKSVQTLTKLTQQGQVISKSCRVAANVLNIGSLAVNGLGLANNFVELTKKNSCGEMTRLDVFQFASSVLFFTMSAVNLKTADTIIKETQSNVIENFESSLRSNRHRRMFRRVAKQTQGEDGNTMQGNAKVIKCISHIDNKDNFFAGLVRVQKQLGKSEAKVSLTDTGMVKLNGELHVDPMKFAQMTKETRQVILDATKNVSQGAWSSERFNTEIHAICQEHQIDLQSQRPATIATINRSLQTRTRPSSQVTKMSTVQVDVITLVLQAFAENFRQRLMDMAVQMAEQLGYPRTFECLVDLVEFLVPFINKVVSEVNGKYETAQAAARAVQGASFNKEVFDAQYNVEGTSRAYFTSFVLNSFMTKEGIEKLCKLYEAFKSEYGDNQAKRKRSEDGPSTSKVQGTDKSIALVSGPPEEPGIQVDKSIGLESGPSEAGRTEPATSGMEVETDKSIGLGTEPATSGVEVEKSIGLGSGPSEAGRTEPATSGMEVEKSIGLESGPSEADSESGGTEPATSGMEVEMDKSIGLGSEADSKSGGPEPATNDMEVDNTETTGPATNGMEVEGSNCILYRRNRDFEAQGVLSDRELYEIAQQVSGLYLFEGNAVLCREGPLAFITVRDKHIDSVTVLVTSDLQGNKVTASIIL